MKVTITFEEGMPDIQFEVPSEWIYRAMRTGINSNLERDREYLTDAFTKWIYLGKAISPTF